MDKPLQRTRRKSSQMFPLVERYESSGLTRNVFCDQEGISTGTFHYWRKKYKEQNSSDHNHSFQQITVLPGPSGHKRPDRYIVIRTPSGMEIKIPLD
jgi:transposase-like protein